MKTRRSFSAESEITDINISPLIDMVFILLIFFIVTTVFVEEKGIGVDKPQPAAATALDKESIVLTITGSGQVVHEGIAIGVGGVAATIRGRTQREQLPVIVDVKKGAISNLVVTVIDQARIAGATNISLTSTEGN